MFFFFLTLIDYCMSVMYTGKVYILENYYPAVPNIRRWNYISINTFFFSF